MDNSYGQDYQNVMKEVVKATLDKTPIVIVVAVIFALIGWSISAFLISPQYEASVNMIVNTRESAVGTVTNDNISSAKNLVDTYAVIIKSNTIINRVISELALDLEYEELYDMLSVDDVNQTQIMKIAVRSNSMENSKMIVETIARIAPPIVADAVEAGSCKVVSDVYYSEKPVSPNVARNTILCSSGGAVAYISILILQVLMNDFIVDDSDVEKKLRLSVLAIIPDVED